MINEIHAWTVNGADDIGGWRCFRRQLRRAHTYSTAGVAGLGERLGSGDGERKTLLTRQIACEPLPASVLFALGCFNVECHR